MKIRKWQDLEQQERQRECDRIEDHETGRCDVETCCLRHDDEYDNDNKWTKYARHTR